MVNEITADELKKRLDAKEKIVLIDCREQDEWDSGHIPGAEFIPLSSLSTRFEEIEDKNGEVILQCRSGKRSMNACMFLMEKGYTNLNNLEGGILAWQQKGYPIIKN